MKKSLTAIAAILPMLGGAHAASIIIDDFDQDLNTGVSLGGGAEMSTNSDVYVSPGGISFDRTLEVNSTNAQGGNIIIASDSLTVNSGNLGEVTGSITWQLSDTSGGLDLTSSGFFESNLLNDSVSTSDDTVSMSLTLVSGVGTMSEMTQTISFELAQGDDMLKVKVSDFDMVDLSDIDRIVLAYDSPEFAGSDYTLTESFLVTAVPVPGALPLMLAGLGFVAARRGRK